MKKQNKEVPVPKKTKFKEILPPKKKKKNPRMYFDADVQDAIVKYNSLDPVKDHVERNKIYSEEIHYAFDKLCENIFNTF